MMPQGSHDTVGRRRNIIGLLQTRGLVLIMLLGLCGGWVWALQTHGAYQGTVRVTFAAPNSAEASDPFTRALNPLSSESRYSLIKLAGVTVRSVAGLHTPPQPVDASVTLLDSGVYDGWSVVQPNDGSQWSYSFSVAGMQVQATGPSAESVTAKIDNLVGKIRASVTAREDAHHVESSQRVKILVSSSPPPVYFESGSRMRAVAGMALLSVLTLVALTQYLHGRQRLA
ncbi:hypothetical protein [Flexivirga oryzae]|uniref:Polysaccharide chain length determinant N-terminal domain-containing protein n=1 Tax=Flexivirga oryzae TaxID=1794944 RepID=A0A839N5Z9_9MICO|nr:hypothetical protein [Flexivirga oryzae]MBB2890152.1 hypothetical protein [Flexivirga oryzae]